MASDHPPLVELQDPEWTEFESLLSDLARLARSEGRYEMLIHSLLEQSVHILAAVGGAAWTFQGSSQPHLQCQVNDDVVYRLVARGGHQKLLEHARLGGEVLAVPPSEQSTSPGKLENHSDYTLFIAPLKLDQDVVGLFEIVQRPSLSAAATRGNRRLIGLVCELAADHLRRQELRLLRDEKSMSSQFDELVARIHGSLDPQAVASELANSSRTFVGCDRIAVALRRGRRYRIAAISGVDTIERRSQSVRNLEELASRVARTNEVVWHDNDRADAIAPQILESLQRLSDESQSRTIGVLPLVHHGGGAGRRRMRVLGVLIIEQFTSVLNQNARSKAERLMEPSALALLNAIRYQALPTLPWLRNRRDPAGVSAARFAVIAATAMIMAALVWFLFVPIEFNISAEGELQPEELQQVFAPYDAQVASIKTRHGDQVEAGQVLVELRSPDLDLESQRVEGELATTQKRISAIQSALLQAVAEDARDEKQNSELAAEEEELTQLAESQRKQLALLRDQRKQLELRSPLTGRVLTWDLEQLLSDRPVQRGQSLLSVGNLEGPWVARLRVPDDRIGHVLEARGDTPQLSATFQLATNRGTEYRGEVRRIANRTESGLDDRSFVRVVLDLNEAEISDLRPGATILAKVHCGRRPAAYVLFHDFIETVRGWFQF